MSRSVKFRRASPNGHYDHQRSDSGFSDCESRASNPDHDYLVPGSYEDHGLYSIRQALETARQESEKWRSRADELEEKLKEVRNDFEQTKAHMRALSNEIEIANQAKDALTKTNKELADENAQLQETLKELKKTNRKSSSGSSPAASSATASESSDEKKVRRSASKRRKEPTGKADKEKERGDRERERGREKERDKERDRERRKEKERALEETERLRKRFDTRGDESDAKSSSTTTKTQRSRHDSYIEPLGHGAPRPQAPVPPSPSRQYTSYPASTAPTAYSTTPAYTSIREPFAATTVPRPHHPAVYVADEYSYGAADDEDAAYVHVHPRSTRHPR
ncbi:hypothetical protein C8A01DRAFT_33915 [Parachaetomium inaequale]|uniref:Uncharacterized protein n=1 Tax=Parachaetomium inaequale TaxID=2588326 RepID=A0AAN6PMU7_9PEZI|nr:hypothetical protein C8A01DRAFT_33915 [Parachaetomium inaequale]